MDSAHEWPAKRTSTDMESSFPIHTLVNFVVAEDMTNEKNRALVLQMETNRVASKLEAQNFFPGNLIQNLKSRLHRQPIRLIKVNLNFRKTVKIVSNPTTLFQVVFANNVKMMKGNGILNLDQSHPCNFLLNTLKQTRIKFFKMNNLHLIL